MEENTSGNASPAVIAVVVAAIIALFTGYYIGFSQGKKSAAAPKTSPEVVNPFEEGKAANSLESIKNPFEGIKTNPFK